MAQTSHRASGLKQSNKQHNKLGHKSKGQVRALCQGRNSIQTISRKAKHELSRVERRNQVKVIRYEKKAKVLNKKRKLGTDTQPPFLACLLMLDPDMNPRTVMTALTGADTSAIVTNSKAGHAHISCTRFRQRYTFVVPPIDDLYAILDMAKVCTTLVVVWPCRDRDEALLGEDQEKLLSCIKAQGLPTPVHVTMGYQDMTHKSTMPKTKLSCEEAEGLEVALSERLSLAPQSSTHSSLHHNKQNEAQSPQQHKRKLAAMQNLMIEVRHYFPGENKAHVHEVDKATDALMCLRQVGSQKQRNLFYRDHRPHLLGEDVIFEDAADSATTGTLKVSGYLRGVPLSVNSLVHIPGWGDYQLSKVVCHNTDPHPLVYLNAKDRVKPDVGDCELRPSIELQESTASTLDYMSSSESEDSGAENDNDEDGSKSCDRRSLTAVPVHRAKIPGPYSAYQAVWMADNENYKESDSEDEEEEEEIDEFEAPAAAADDTASVCPDSDDDDDNMSTMSGSEVGVSEAAYDDKIDYEEEMGDYNRMKEYHDDKEFPDEIDTPRDVHARLRFNKYRGLESFKTSPWDLAEGLPTDYKTIFHLPKFNIIRKKILTKDPEDNDIMVGQYVTLYIKDVQKHLYKDHVKSRSPLVLFGLLLHEQKMALVNLVIKSHTTEHRTPIKSKDRLVYHVGFRRFANQAIFSEHTAGDKQKFCRFFHPGETVVASMYAPVTYPPASVLVFKERSGGKQKLVATGSVYNVDANRCILKRQILSGHPFKINKKSAVIRYMFFNRDDISWFKPIELKTKWGRRGKITEALGTHGHMKCKFNRQLKSQDAIMLYLYKRVFPKWSFDPHVSRHSPLYRSGLFDKDESDDEEDETTETSIKFQEKIDRFLMPPPSKRPKQVHFE